MPLDWPDQARFLEVIRSLRSASRSKLDEIVALARKDARKYYKHSVAILVKQIQVKKPRQRVPVLYAINSLCAAGDDDEVKKLFASRFSRDILKCVEAALKCPPQHLAGVRRVVVKWRKRSAFPPPIVAAAAALVDGYAGWDPSLIDNRDDDVKDTDGFDVDDYVPSSDECSDGEGEDKGMTAKDDGGDGADAKPSIDAADDEAGLTAAEPSPPVKVPRAKKVRAWGAAPKRPERPAVQSQNGGTHAQTGPTGTEAKTPDEPLAWNPPPPSAPIATNPASNPPPPASMAAARGGVIGAARGVIGAGVEGPTAQVSRVASNSSPPRRRSPPAGRTDRSSVRGVAGAGKKGGGRDGDRGRDRRRSRDSGRREPKVEVDRWGDPVRRVSREPSADDGYGGGVDEPRRRSPPPPPAAARARSPPKVRSPPRARSSSPERRAPKKQKKRAPLPPSPEKKRTPPR